MLQLQPYQQIIAIKALSRGRSVYVTKGDSCNDHPLLVFTFRPSLRTVLFVLKPNENYELDPLIRKKYAVTNLGFRINNKGNVLVSGQVNGEHAAFVTPINAYIVAADVDFTLLESVEALQQYVAARKIIEADLIKLYLEVHNICIQDFDIS